MPVSPLTVRPAVRTGAVCSILFAATILLFSRSTGYGFSVYDDPSYVTNNPHVQQGLTWTSAVWAFTARTDYWHPLTWLSHMLDWQLYGPSADGHHLTSILWHGVNGVVVFLVLRRLTGAYWSSAFAAALFAWHPLRVESVVWITERKDVMSGFFFLVAIWAYADYVRRRDQQRPAASYYLLTLALFIAGLMSKPMLVSFPLILLVLDAWPLRRWSLTAWSWTRARSLLIEKMPFFVLSGIASVVTIRLQQHEAAFVLDLPFAARLGNAVVSLARYIGKFLWPADLAVCYPHPGYWPVGIWVSATLLALAITALAWRQRERRPWLITGWLGFVGLLLPAIGLIQVGFQAMADRYTYLATLGLEIGLVWTVREWAHFRGVKWLMTSLAVATLAAAGVRTWHQQATWRDPIVMFQHAIDLTEENEYAHALLSYTLFTRDRLDEAERHARRSLELNPRNKTALISIAHIRDRQNRLKDAIAAYRDVLSADPQNTATTYRLGILLLGAGSLSEATPLILAAIRDDSAYFDAVITHALAAQNQRQPAQALALYRVALAAHPQDPTALFGAGLALKNLGQTSEAAQHWEKILAVEPGHVPALTELGLMALSAGDFTAAASKFRAALRSEPNHGVALVGLGRAAERLGLTNEATASFERALSITPNAALPRRAWAETLARRRQFDLALNQYQRAVELEPNNAEGQAGLGYALMLTGRPPEALAAWEAALRIDPAFPGLRQRVEQMKATESAR